MNRSYDGLVLGVIDGQTVDVMVSLGLQVYKEVRVGLLGVEAPTILSPAGERARDYLAALLPINKKVLLSSTEYRVNEFGHLLGEIRSPDYDVFVNALMVVGGYARQHKKHLHLERKGTP